VRSMEMSIRFARVRPESTGESVDDFGVRGGDAGL